MTQVSDTAAVDNMTDIRTVERLYSISLEEERSTLGGTCMEQFTLGSVL